MRQAFVSLLIGLVFFAAAQTSHAKGPEYNVLKLSLAGQALLSSEKMALTIAQNYSERFGGLRKIYGVPNSTKNYYEIVCKNEILQKYGSTTSHLGKIINCVQTRTESKKELISASYRISEHETVTLHFTSKEFNLPEQKKQVDGITYVIAQKADITKKQFREKAIDRYGEPTGGKLNSHGALEWGHLSRTRMFIDTQRPNLRALNFKISLIDPSLEARELENSQKAAERDRVKGPSSMNF